MLAAGSMIYLPVVALLIIRNFVIPADKPLGFSDVGVKVFRTLLVGPAADAVVVILPPPAADVGQLWVTGTLD